MITDRYIAPEDYEQLSRSLEADEYHQGTDADFFYAIGTLSKVFEDEKGTIAYLRGAKALRLDVQFVDNNDRRRNAAALVYGFNSIVEKAKDNGFSEIIFQSYSDDLRDFCIAKFGFTESDGELRKFI